MNKLIWIYFILLLFITTNGFSVDTPMLNFKRKTISFFEKYIVKEKVSKREAKTLLDDIENLDPSAIRYTDKMKDTRYELWFETLENVEKQLFRYEHIGKMDEKVLAKNVLEYHYRAIKEYNYMFTILVSNLKGKKDYAIEISNVLLSYGNYYLKSYKNLKVVVDKIKTYDNEFDAIRKGNYILDHYDFMEDSLKQIEDFKKTGKMKHIKKLLKFLEESEK